MAFCPAEFGAAVGTKFVMPVAMEKNFRKESLISQPMDHDKHRALGVQPIAWFPAAEALDTVKSYVEDPRKHPKKTYRPVQAIYWSQRKVHRSSLM